MVKADCSILFLKFQTFFKKRLAPLQLPSFKLKNKEKDINLREIFNRPKTLAAQAEGRLLKSYELANYVWLWTFSAWNTVVKTQQYVWECDLLIHFKPIVHHFHISFLFYLMQSNDHKIHLKQKEILIDLQTKLFSLRKIRFKLQKYIK